METLRLDDNLRVWIQKLHPRVTTHSLTQTYSGTLVQMGQTKWLPKNTTFGHECSREWAWKCKTKWSLTETVERIEQRSVAKRLNEAEYACIRCRGNFTSWKTKSNILLTFRSSGSAGKPLRVVRPTFISDRILKFLKSSSPITFVERQLSKFSSVTYKREGNNREIGDEGVQTFSGNKNGETVKFCRRKGANTTFNGLLSTSLDRHSWTE